MQNKNARYQLRLPATEKERWQEYANEHNHGKIANLIRQSVNRTVSHEVTTTSSVEMATELRQMRIEMNKMMSMMQTLQMQVVASQSQSKLAGAIAQAIVPKGSSEDTERTQAQQMLDAMKKVGGKKFDF